MSKTKEIHVEVVFTDGYQRRFTEACLRQYKLKNEKKNGCAA